MKSEIVKSFANNMIEEMIEQKYIEYIENREKDEDIENKISGCDEFERELEKLKELYKNDKLIQCSIEKIDSLKNEIVSEKGYFKYLEGFKLGLEFSKVLNEISK